MHRLAFAAGFAFAVGMGGVATANAGLLDFIFGWRDRTDIQRAAPSPQRHPYVTIHGDRRSRSVAARPRPAAKPAPRLAARPAKSLKPPAPALAPKEQLARTIDPAKNPGWYLEDATLRKGDVLVLNDRVLVFTGGKLGSPKSYVALSRSKLLSGKERARIATMTGRDAEPSVAAAAPEKPRKFRAAFRLRGAEGS